MAAVTEDRPGTTAQVRYVRMSASKARVVLNLIRGKHVGEALMRQLTMNLRALGIDRVETQVDWDQLDLIGFFQHAGFRPAPRLCLELPLE